MRRSDQGKASGRSLEPVSPGSRTAGRFIKVIFELPRDDDGWPPAGSEGLWAVPVTSDVVRLEHRDGPPLSGSRQRVLDMFAPLGVTGEGIEQFSLVALDVPPDADIAA